MAPTPCDLSRFTPEFQLACQCCRVEPDLVEIARLLERVDLQSFLQLVLERHRVGPLVHAALKLLPATAVPSSLLNSLAAATRDNAIRYLRAQRSIQLLARGFDEAGIDWLPLKGITVAQRYYADAALRHVNDLDIWVPAEQLQGARAVLHQMGFRRDIADRQWNLAERGPRHLDYLMRFYHEEHLRSDEFGMLELHWRLTPAVAGFGLQAKELLARAQALAWDGPPLRAMDETDQFLHLCVHGAGHGWFRLKWLVDLPRLLDTRNWDWSQVFARARHLDCASALVLSLALCRDLFGWSPPPAVADQLQRMRGLPLVLAVVRLALQAPGDIYTGASKLPMSWRLRDLGKSVLLSDSRATLADLLWRRILSPNDMLMLNVPDRWFGVYYLLRPLLFAVRYART